LISQNSWKFSLVKCLLIVFGKLKIDPHGVPPPPPPTPQLTPKKSSDDADSSTHQKRFRNFEVLKPRNLNLL
jgi:hypothetical protein